MAVRFTEPVLRVLRSAGWSEGRRVDTAGTEAYLREWGLPLIPTALAILREFEGLKCRADETDRKLTFDVPEALMWFDSWQAPALTWLTSQPLCPVAYGDRMVWFVAESGEVICLHDEWLGFTREPSFPSALEGTFGAKFECGPWANIDEEYELKYFFAQLKLPESERDDISKIPPPGTPLRRRDAFDGLP